MSLRNPHPLDDQFYKNAMFRNGAVGFAFALLLLIARLIHLQVIQGDYHEKLSEQNSMRLQVVRAPRGLILDRNGKVLAHNRPSIQIAILPTELKDPKMVYNNLLRFTDSTGKMIFDSTLLKWTLQRGKWKKFQPLIIHEDAAPELVAMIEEHQMDLPGVVTVVESRRSYPNGANAGHVLGYMDEVKEDEIQNLVENGDSLAYTKGDRVGRKGLERHYEKYFRGKDGIRYVRVNAFGKEIEVLADMPHVTPIPGSNLVTSIDMELQNFAETLLPDSVKGSIVAIDPRNGEVIVIASSPRMNSNIFSLSREQRNKEWAKLALDPNRPLNNRATVGGYEPGSTFKGVVSLAGFRSGFHPTDHMQRGCSGGYRFGNRFWRCWNPKGHGSLNFFDAFTQSCDAYYYQLGLSIGMNPINEVAKEFGFGRKTGIDLDEERSGELVDSGTYTRKYKKRGWTWTRGLVLNLSIGQGQIATPLQLANYAAGLGNGKVLYKPHFIKEIRSPDGKNNFHYTPEIASELHITKEQHEAILKAMEMVVNSPSGTGGRAKVTDIIVGGKTGSAENPHGDKTHALFIGVAPLYAPELAIAVVLENIGHGGSFAAPIAGEVFKHYFQRQMVGQKQPVL